MGRAPCCDKENVKKGPWSPEEDAKLKEYIEKNGTGNNWIAFPQKAGLRRCGKSCRLRWLNYLRPNIRHGDFSDYEDWVISTLYANIGSRWSIIAAQLPGRTDNDIKNYWNTKLKKKFSGLFPPSNTPRRTTYHQQTSFLSSPTPSFLHNVPSAPLSSLSTFGLSSAPLPLHAREISFEKPEIQQQQQQHYQIADSSSSIVHGGGEASCSSSDGSFTNNYRVSDIGGVTYRDQMVSFDDYYPRPSYHGLENLLEEDHHSGFDEIKELISTNNNSGSSSSNNNNFLFDENKVEEESVFLYY